MLIISLVSSSSYAQLQGDVVVSGGIGYIFNSNLNALGYGGGAEYWVFDGMGIAGQFHKFSKEGMSYSLIDFDVRYYFIDVGAGIYGSAGYSIINTTDGGNGINLGSGVIIPVSCSVGIITELKYSMINVSTESGAQKLGLGLNVGAVFRLF